VQLLEEHCGQAEKFFQCDYSCNHIVTFIEDTNQIIKGLNALHPAEPLFESIKEVVTRICSVPLDEKDNRDLLKGTFLNEPCIDNL
jgi:hypothetical protein